VSNNSSMSELEQLKGLGLAKSLKSQFTDTAKANESSTQAYQAQQKDLQERKAKTKSFTSSSNYLSAADATQLEYSKKKKEDRVKEREALGFYQSHSYRGDGSSPASSMPQDGNKEWKMTGKVLTTTGMAPDTTTTKEWQAPNENGKMEVSPTPNFTTTTITTKGAGRTAAASTEEEVKQGCGCIIL
jgi:hypothetical protein